jgi:hypothetical protein
MRNNESSSTMGKILVSFILALILAYTHSFLMVNASKDRMHQKYCSKYDGPTVYHDGKCFLEENGVQKKLKLIREYREG